jgi:hypothetical protein
MRLSKTGSLAGQVSAASREERTLLDAPANDRSRNKCFRHSLNCGKRSPSAARLERIVAGRAVPAGTAHND